MKKNINQYSNSKISTYEQCKFKYKLRYLSDTESSFDIIEAFMGSRVHDALEKLYLDLQMTKLLSLDELLSFYYEIWDKHWNENIHIVKKEYSKDDYRRKGEKCLKDFYNRYTPFNQDKTIALEKGFRFNINDKYTIFGIIDRLAKSDDGTFIIHDYKTSNILPAQEEIDADRQLPLYQLGVKSLWPEAKEIRPVYHYLAFDVELSSGQSRTAEEEKRLKNDLIGLIREIELTEEYPPATSSLCNWCNYQPYCPKRKHLFKVESLPKELYHEDDGVKLVDEYVRLWVSQGEIKQSIDEIKDRIIKYAKREDVETMKGSNYKIYAKTKIQKSFPAKDDPVRKELEELLKTSGKWNEVSILWLSFLQERLKSGKWNQELISKVTSFQIDKENNWVSPPYKLRIG